MLETVTTVTGPTVLFTGSLISPFTIIILVALLFSTAVLFSVMSKEMAQKKAFGLSVAMYLMMAIWTVAWI